MTTQATCGCACHEAIQNAWACQCTCGASAIQGLPQSKSDSAAKARGIAEKMLNNPYYDLNIYRRIDLIAAALQAERKAGREETMNLILKDSKSIDQKGYRRGLEEGAQQCEHSSELDSGSTVKARYTLADRIRQLGGER